MIAVKRMANVWLGICLILVMQQCWGAQPRPSKQLEAFNTGVEKTRNQDSLIDGLQVMTKNIAQVLMKDANEFRQGLQQGLDNALRLLPQLSQDAQRECFNNIEKLMLAAQGKEKILGHNDLDAVLNPRRETLSRLKIDYQALERERDVARQQLEQIRLVQEQEHQQAEQVRGVHQQQLVDLQQQLAMARQELAVHRQDHQQMVTALQRQLEEARQQLAIAQKGHQQALAALEEQKKREVEEAKVVASADTQAIQEKHQQDQAQLLKQIEENGQTLQDQARAIKEMDEKYKQLAELRDQEIANLKKENEENRLALEQRMRDQARTFEKNEELARRQTKETEQQISNLEQMLKIKDDEIKMLKSKEALFNLNNVITDAPLTHDFLSFATPNNVIQALEKWLGKEAVEQPQDAPLSLKDLVEMAGRFEKMESVKTSELMDFLKMIVHKIQKAKLALNEPVYSLANDMQNKEANPDKKFTRTDIEKARKKHRKAWWKAHDQEILLENLVRDLNALERQIRARD